MILISSLAIFKLYINAVIKNANEINEPTINEKGNSLPYMLFSVLILASCFFVFQHTIVDCPSPEKSSDVLPQLDAQINRFLHHQNPYAPVPLVGYSPFPVYMPLHFLPILFSKLLHIDIRYSGFVVFVCLYILYCFMIPLQNKMYVKNCFIIALPVLILIGYLKNCSMDMAVTFELPVAAYYMIVCLGLLKRNLSLVLWGVICCFLSRYTLVFWMPLLIILMLQNERMAINMQFVFIIILAIVFIYIVPFYILDTSVFLKGIAYHNGAAIEEWKGYGNPAVSWSFEVGLHFAAHLKSIFTSGTMEHRVFLARVIQALFMLGTLLWGILFYNKHKKYVNYFDVAMGFLYLCLLFFYQFGPLTYRYYFISFSIISAFLCIRVLQKTTSKIV